MKAKLQQIYKEIGRNQSVADKRAKGFYNKYTNDKEFQIDSRVWLDNPTHKARTSAKLQVKYKGPFTVTARPIIMNYEITPTYGDIIANKANLVPLIGPSHICNIYMQY